MILYASTLGDFIGILAVLLGGAALSLWLCRLFKVSQKRSLLLYGWHTAFGVAFAAYVAQNGGDGIDYYWKALNGDVHFAVGTAAIGFFAYLFANVLGLTFLGTNLAFGFFGFIGLLAFDGSLQKVVAYKSGTIRFIASLVVMFPSISFWTGGLGKDPIAFMAVGLALWSSLDTSRRTRFFIAAAFLMLTVRPHVAGMLVVAYAGSLWVQKGIPTARRILLMLFAAAGVILLLPFAANYAGVGGLSSIEMSSYVEKREHYDTDAGGAIDISSMSLPVKLFTYVFRPLPFEASSLSTFAASMENVVLLCLAILAAWQWIRKRSCPVAWNRFFMCTYSLLAWVVLAETTANLGISARQKWMFLPMILFLCFSLADGGKKRRPRAPEFGDTNMSKDLVSHR